MRLYEKYGTARQATDDNIIRRMRFECLVSKVVETHSGICNNYRFSTPRMVIRTRLKARLYFLFIV